MSELSVNRKNFFELMKKGPLYERRGFDFLLKRDDFDSFFDVLKAEGFFDPVRNPAPVPVDASGAVQIPYWAALDYLIACSKKATEKSDSALAGAVMGVVRAVSQNINDNFRTAHKFAEIIGLLPATACTIDDMDLVASWLSTRFDHSLVVSELDEGALKKFLASEESDDLEKAARILSFCTVVRWKKQSDSDLDDGEPVGIVDDYWLFELVKHRASEFGRRVPKRAAAIFEQRIRDVFTKGSRAEWSYIVRPAVESHTQNHSWDRLENALVDGLRDVVLTWCDVEPDAAKTYVGTLLHDDVQMLRRIALYLLGERWTSLKDLYSGLITKELINDPGHIHELYHLLQRRFPELQEGDKAATLKVLRDLSPPEGEDSERRLRIFQLRWLSALGTSYQPAADWLSELRKDTSIGLSDHPDFHAYTEVSWGPGPSPYKPPELVAFAQDKKLVAKLNAFKPTDVWRGSPLDALVSALEEAVKLSPETFLRELPAFADVEMPFQHAVIRGFKTVWESTGSPSSIDWNAAWSGFLTLSETLVGKEGFWENVDAKEREYSRSWTVSAIADCLASGTRDDSHAAPLNMMPRFWSLIRLCVDKMPSRAEADDSDPMTRAINTAKGRAIEALYSYALRSCRLADKESESHESAWAALQPLFDSELKKCEHGNCEFSTLLGAYLSNLEYMNRKWLEANIASIFPFDRADNFVCAIAGLAYSAPTRYVYGLLRDAGVLDAAVATDLRGRDTREKLIERLMVGYLWGEDSLDSKRLAYAFENDRVADLEDGAWFFWSVRGESLSSDQRAKIIGYWAACVDWAQKQSNPPTKLMAALGHLAWSIEKIDATTRDLLFAVAPSMQLHHNVYELLEELDRLASVNPVEVGEVLRRLVQNSGPVYDYEDRLKKLIEKLFAMGEKDSARYACNKLIALPGMPELFKKMAD